MTTIRTEPPASRSRLHYTSRCEPEPCAAPPQDESGWSPEPVPRAAQVAVRQPGTVASGRREIPGAKTLSDARSFLGHFAIWPGEAALDTVALWAAHAHARGADGMLTWQASPRLLFSSAEPGAGKSYAMRLVARICPARAVFTEPSEPAVAHAIGRDHATLALDEIDVLFGRGQRKAAIRAVINDGYTPTGRGRGCAAARSTGSRRSARSCSPAWTRWRPPPTGTCGRSSPGASASGCGAGPRAGGHPGSTRTAAPLRGS